MAAKRKAWMISPGKSPRPSVPDSIKTEVEAKANDLIENVLKPKHVRAAEKRRAVQLHHRHRGEMVQELLLLLLDLRLPRPECPLAHVRVEVCSDGTPR